MRTNAFLLLLGSLWCACENDDQTERYLELYASTHAKLCVDEATINLGTPTQATIAYCRFTPGYSSVGCELDTGVFGSVALTPRYSRYYERWDECWEAANRCARRGDCPPEAGVSPLATRASAQGVIYRSGTAFCWWGATEQWSLGQQACEERADGDIFRHCTEDGLQIVPCGKYESCGFHGSRYGCGVP